jgi:hypothetical protein
MERAKEGLAEKVDDVKEKVSPKRLAQKGADSVRRGVRSAVGSDDDGDAGGQVTQSAARRTPQVAGAARGRSQATGAARGQTAALARRARGAAASVADAPDSMRQQTRGNPLAAGLLAFAAGFGAAALLPPTRRERELVEKARGGVVEPLADQAREVGRNVAGELQSTARQSLEQLKETATDAALTAASDRIRTQVKRSTATVKEEAQDASEEVKGQAKSAAQNVKGEAKGAARQTKGEAKGAARQAGATTRKRATTTKQAAGTKRAATTKRAGGTKQAATKSTAKARGRAVASSR